MGGLIGAKLGMVTRWWLLLAIPNRIALVDGKKYSQYNSEISSHEPDCPAFYKPSFPSQDSY
jgi:hypothetical protein